MLRCKVADANAAVQQCRQLSCDMLVQVLECRRQASEDILQQLWVSICPCNRRMQHAIPLLLLRSGRCIAGEALLSDASVALYVYAQQLCCGFTSAV